MNTSTKTASGVDVRNLTICAMCIAMTYIATAFINIRLPIAANGGLIHMGNTVLFLAAAVFGKRTGAIAGAVGMGLFDLLGGWLMWAPFTFVIVGLMGFTAGLLLEKGFGFPRYCVAVITALIIKIGGYYIAEGIIYGNWIAPITSIPGNVVQVVVGTAVAYPIIRIVSRFFKNQSNA